MGRLSHYSIGADDERRVKKILQGQGYYVHRSAGSKGTDLFAVLKRTHFDMESTMPVFRAVMVTRSRTLQKFKEDRTKLLAANYPTMVSLEIWVRQKEGRKTTWDIKEVSHEV